MRQAILLLIGLGALAFSSQTASAGELWIYLSTNLQSPGRIAQAEEIFSRAAKAGYTHVLISDSKFGRLAAQPPSYRENCMRVRESARRHGLILVPALFGLGYSNDHLQLDPNLAEGLPVKDALFVVHKGEAQIVADPPVALPACGESERPQWKFVDPTLLGSSDTFEASDPAGNARFHQRIPVAKYRYYTVSVRVRTQDFSGEPECKVLTLDGRSLSYTNLQVARTQEWTTHRITFNSLDHDVVGIYFGTWGSAKGTIWWKEPGIQEEGLLNVLRRDGCPLLVQIEGGRELKEGVDFEPVADPLLARHPGSGDYDVWHEAPPIRANLPDGTRLRVSFYHPHIFNDGQVCICPSEPKTLEILRTQARDLHNLWQADNYMMLHDEWRLLGWDEACLRCKLPAGKLVADNVAACRQILAEAAPRARVHVWSDMFDPHHNAVKDYYLVNGDLHGSWDGLDRSIVIMNWNSDKPTESPAFFAQRGHRQILAGYYDRDPSAITSWLAAARKAPGVIGVMYTTWKGDYSQLEEFARLVSEAEQAP
jgi:hypothetical protein